jgi:hypothetical protein
MAGQRQQKINIFSDAWDFLTKASRRLLHGKEARAPDYSGN